MRRKESVIPMLTPEDRQWFINTLRDVMDFHERCHHDDPMELNKRIADLEDIHRGHPADHRRPRLPFALRHEDV